MKTYSITMIPGDGIGPEVSSSTVNIINSTGVKIDWDIVEAGEHVLADKGVLIPDEAYKSIEKNKIVLKGPITTPIGVGFRSVNVHLRKKYDLYANIRPVSDLWKKERRDIDMVIFRENTEGLYIGVETQISEDHFEATKKVTTAGSYRIVKEAFEYAKNNNLEKVTVAHKANILKISDGHFLRIAREVSKTYDIELEEVIIDNMCMQMVMNPSQFQVIVTMNLYGDILSDLGAGLVGGLGLIPSANIGEKIAMFEAVHGSAPDIAGKGLANPIALARSGAMMLKYLGENEAGEKIESSINKVLQEGKVLTSDLGGNSSTTDIEKEIIAKIMEG